jgi:hypothetical protein
MGFQKKKILSQQKYFKKLMDENFRSAAEEHSEGMLALRNPL